MVDTIYEISLCAASESNQRTESLKGHHNVRSHQATVTTAHKTFHPFWALKRFANKCISTQKIRIIFVKYTKDKLVDKLEAHNSIFRSKKRAYC